jgi:hypothetical protein
MASKSYGAGKAVRGAGIQAQRGAAKAGKFAKANKGKIAAGAGLAAAAGAAVGGAHLARAGRRKMMGMKPGDPGYKRGRKPLY